MFVINYTWKDKEWEDHFITNWKFDLFLFIVIVHCALPICFIENVIAISCYTAFLFLLNFIFILYYLFQKRDDCEDIYLNYSFARDYIRKNDLTCWKGYHQLIHKIIEEKLGWPIWTMVINKRERFYIMPLRSDGATRNGATMSYRVRFEILEEGHIRKVLGWNRKIYIRRYRLVAWGSLWEILFSFLLQFLATQFGHENNCCALTITHRCEGASWRGTYEKKVSKRIPWLFFNNFPIIPLMSCSLCLIQIAGRQTIVFAQIDISWSGQAVRRQWQI